MAQSLNMSRDGRSGGGSGLGSGTVGLPSRAMQHTWAELTRSRPWRSLSLVPTDEATSTLELALEMAQMGSLDPRNRVLVINASGVASDSGASMRLGAPPPAAAGGAGVAAQHGRFWVLDCAAQQMSEAQVGMVEIPKQAELLRAGTSPYTLLLVASGALLSRPPMVTTARSVDCVALCVVLGRSTFADTRRTAELVGNENILGSVAMRARRGRR